MSKINNIIETLRQLYPDAECSLEYGGDPYKLLITARLSAQCTDERVNIVAKPLFEKYPTLYDMAAANQAEVEDMIRPCGLYRTKAESCIAMCRRLAADFGGEVPDNMEDLLSLPGVGRKIANLLLGDLYHKGGIVADTHCIRICGRLGFYPESQKDPLKTERTMAELVPLEEQSDFCHRIVHFGREWCTAKNPRCPECPMRAYCSHGRGKSGIMTMPIPAPVEFVLDRLISRGHSAHVVGGCVRDYLMGRKAGDYDVTTSALPEEMIEAFSDSRVVETGLKHGTVTIVKDGMNIETTTYRIDGEYGDSRHPESVTFTKDIADDLCRRDFTVNAMAYSPESGLVDLYGGRRDIENRLIRCVGRARDRFSEDALRIMRAIRFASTLDFAIEEECAIAINDLYETLEHISRERIYVELTKLLMGKAAGRVLMAFPHVVIQAVWGHGYWLSTSSCERTSRQIGRLQHRTPASAYALLFSDMEPAEAKSAIESLKPSRSEERAVMALINEKNAPVSTAYELKKLMQKYGDSFPVELADYNAALGLISRAEADQTEETCAEIIEKNEPRRLSELAVTGNDLSDIGITGAEIGKALARLMDRVMLGELENDKASLLKEARHG